MSVSELGPYHARSGIDRFLHPRRYGGPNYAAFDVANHFWEWCGGLDDSATPRFERYPTETTRRAWIEALLRARAAATSGDGCGSGVVEPAAVDRFCRAVDIFAPLDHLFWGLWAVTQAAALGRTTGFRYLLYASHRLSHPSVAEAVGRVVSWGCNTAYVPCTNPGRSRRSTMSGTDFVGTPPVRSASNIATSFCRCAFARARQRRPRSRFSSRYGRIVDHGNSS